MKRGLISRNEKLNEIKEVAEKVYVSAGIGGDEYTSYPNIAVTTVNNGKTFKYIAPANISPARKAYEEKKVKQQLEEIAKKGVKFNIPFSLFLSDDSGCEAYNLNTEAEFYLPEEYTEEQAKRILITKIEEERDKQDNSQLFEKIFREVKSDLSGEELEYISGKNYIKIDYDSYTISSNEYEVDYSNKINIKFTCSNGEGVNFILNYTL